MKRPIPRRDHLHLGAWFLCQTDAFLVYFKDPQTIGNFIWICLLTVVAWGQFGDFLRACLRRHLELHPDK